MYITLTGRLSSSAINKEQEKSGLRRWTFTTILWRNNNKTTIFDVYRPGSKAIELVGNSTVINQQWVLLQQFNRKEYPCDIIINDIVKAVKQKQQHNHDIILIINSNETITLSSGGIAKVFRECRLFDPLHQQHGETIEGPSHINRSERIDFIFVTAKLLPFIKTSKSTGFNKLTNLDHKGLYIDIL